MRAHYDFSKMKARRNPYIKLLKQSVTIRLDRNTVDYFRTLASSSGVPYQSLINLYLRDCALNKRELTLQWSGAQRGMRAPLRTALRERRRRYSKT